MNATKRALRGLARRYQYLNEEIGGLDEQLDVVVAQAAPKPVAPYGVGTIDLYGLREPSPLDDVFVVHGARQCEELEIAQFLVR